MLEQIQNKVWVLQGRLLQCINLYSRPPEGRRGRLQEYTKRGEEAGVLAGAGSAGFVHYGFKESCS